MPSSRYFLRGLIFGHLQAMSASDPQVLGRRVDAAGALLVHVR